MIGQYLLNTNKNATVFILQTNFATKQGGAACKHCTVNALQGFIPNARTSFFFRQQM